jgi:hypothetical protein
LDAVQSSLQGGRAVQNLIAVGGLRMRRPRIEVPRDRVLLALAAVLGMGLLLRVWFLLAWRPALTGYSDSGIYFTGAVKSLWMDPLRTVGYSMFLRALHAISPHLILVTIVQHLLGLLTAVLLFGTVRRCGGPRWLGLVPAAFIALSGDQLFLEHAALSEALYIFLIAAMLYCTVRASQGRAWWAAGAGLCAGLSVWDRAAALALVPLIPLWLLFSALRPTRRTLALGALSLLLSLATIGGYVAWREAASGLSGLTTNSSWNLYGRVAPWADCTKFTPPRGTARLCDSWRPAEKVLPTGARLTDQPYIYDPNSPAWALLGPPFFVSTHPHAMTLLKKWSVAAIEGQPLDYLHAVWLDLARLIDTNRSSYGALSADEMIAFFIYGPDLHTRLNPFVELWQHRLYPADPREHRGDLTALIEWERITRLVGVPMAILLLLCLAAPWLAIGRQPRAGATLFTLTAVVLLLWPILTAAYDYRYVIPASGPLGAAGALAAWGLVVRIKGLRRLPDTRGRDGSLANG